MGLESHLGDNILTTTLNTMVNWARKSSLWPMPFGLACCAIEMMAAVAPRYDLARFGAEVFRFSPRQSDLMIVAGTLTYKMAPVARRIYDQMPEPKWVIAMGACAISGVFLILTVSFKAWIRLCPWTCICLDAHSRPEALIHAIMEIQKKIEKESVLNKITANIGDKPQI